MLLPLFCTWQKRASQWNKARAEREREVVNFTNILRADFATIFSDILSKKIQTQICERIKALHNTCLLKAAYKMLVKFTPVGAFINISHKSRFCANFISTKNVKPKLGAHKNFAKHFSTKKLFIKCWWNWHQGDSAYLLNVIILRSRVGGRE